MTGGRESLCLPWLLCLFPFLGCTISGCTGRYNVGSVEHPAADSGAPDAGPGPSWEPIRIRTQAQKTAGLAGGEGMQQVVDIKYAPSNPAVVYMTSASASTWKSTNGGTSWELKNNGIRVWGGSSIAVSPVDENIVLVAGGPCCQGEYLDWSGVAHGIFKTTNGGDEWKQVFTANYYLNNGGSGNGRQLAFANAEVVYATTLDKGLWKSTDVGETWNEMRLAQLTGDRLSAIKVHPDDSSLLFVASVTDQKLRRVTGGGAAILDVGARLPPGTIYTLEVISNKNADFTDDTVLVTVGNAGVYKSTDSGATFGPLNGASPRQLPVGGREYGFLAVSPADSNVLYAAMVEDVRVFYSHDGGANWYAQTSADEKNLDGWVIGSLTGESISNTQDRGMHYWNKPLAPHPIDRSVALSVGGVTAVTVKTTDGGLNWRYSSTGYSEGPVGWPSTASAMTSIAFDGVNPRRFVMFLLHFGAYLTENNGDTFRPLGHPSYLGQYHTMGGALEPASNTLITAAGTLETRAIRITRDVREDSPVWASLDATAENHTYSFLAFHPTAPAVAYAGRYRFDNVQTSDAYTTLSRSVRAMFPGDGNVVYALEAVGATATRLYRSDDRGANWVTTTHRNPGTPYPLLPAQLNASQTIGQIAVDPNDKDTLYFPVFGRGVYAVRGDMVTLLAEENGLEKSWSGLLEARNVAIDPRNSATIYVGYSSDLYGLSKGVFRSIDSGSHFQNISFNLGGNFTTTFLTVSPTDGYVYFGSNMGTWKLPPP